MRKPLLQRCCLTGLLVVALAGCSRKPATPPQAQPPPMAPPTEYATELKQPGRALVLQIEREPWEALAAVCLTPAFYNRRGATPLLFDDGSEKRDVSLPHETAALQGFGGDAAAATARIARTYWRRAESVFVVETYEQALWVVPSAAFMVAPILVNPDRETLDALGAGRAVVVGKGKPPVKHVVNLASKEDVWRFQMELFRGQGQKCDYVVMTNPHDADKEPNPNVQWPYLSLAAAPLAAHRLALVQTGDYTGDRKRLHALGGAVGSPADRARYEFVKPIFQKVKDDANAAAKFLLDSGQKPEYLAMVGGSIELPYYFCDIHVRWKYWESEIHYAPSDCPYATLRNDVDFKRFVKPDMAPGRIIADSVLDATLLLVKGFFRKDFRAGGKYAAGAPSGWERRSVVIDGDRLNQPDEGGPPATSREPYYPSREVLAVWKRAGYNGTYALPHDVVVRKDNNPPVEELLRRSGRYGYVQFVGHGGPGNLRLEIGRGKRKKGENYRPTGPVLRKLLRYAAPTVIYVIGCETGTVYEPFPQNEQFLPMSFIHAGAAAYIAPHVGQSFCFWRYAPKGPIGSQVIYFWENALGKGMPIGKALVEAKWRAYTEWKDRQSEPNRGKDSDNAIEADGPMVLLFGDPALELVGGERKP